MKKLLALLAVLGMVNVASAAVTWGYDLNPTTTSFEGATFSNVEGYDHYVIYLKVTGSEVVRSFDVSASTPANAIREYVKKPFVGTASPITAFSWNEDTGEDEGKTTVALTQSQIDAGACKGSLVQTSTRTTSGYEDISFVKYAYGISGEAGALWASTGWNSTGNNDLVAGEAGKWDVMNLYVKQGVVTTVNFGAAAGDAGEGIYFQETFAIPEPATIGLLVMGVVGMLRRKLA